MASSIRVQFLARRFCRSALSVGALAGFAFACGQRDLTLTSPISEPDEATETAPRAGFFEPLPEDVRWPLRMASPSPAPEPTVDETPAAGTGLQPVSNGLGSVPDAGVPPGGEAGEPPLDCSAITPTPASFELLEGFTSSEDFVFDELGNYVGIDDDNNLVRISRDRKRTLWLPKIGSLAGMGILPDGSVVFCEVEKGALERVYPNGSVAVVLGGLLYPNGLDIGPDGFIYVAENNGGRVRRVNPDTGEFTIAAMGLHGPNGVAFSDDPHVLYVGSFEGSGVYKVEIPAPGELGRATVFARPPGSTLRAPVLACPDQVEGTDCKSLFYTSSKCQALANVVDCLPVDPCPELEDGQYCDHPGGVCRNHTCEKVPTCEELGEGAVCEEPGYGRGTCEVVDGYAFCAPPNPCDGSSEGDACEDPFSGPGVCQTVDDYTYCTPPNPCEGLEDGAACQDSFSGPGTCRVLDGGEGFDDFIYCEAVNPCEGLEEGAACEDFFSGPGVCRTLEAPDGSEPYTYCESPNPCDGLRLGAACEDPSSGPGVCQRFDGYTYCGPPGPCEELSDGAACEDPYGGTGVCQRVDGQAFCAPPNSCYERRAGDICEDTYGTAGECTDNEGTLYCATPDVCPDGRDGDPCVDPLAGVGSCQGGGCVAYEPTGGGIDGLGVDACGNVYASEYTYGKVWRISPTGQIQFLTELPSSWIPNIKWGRGLGGFSSDVMYVADRERRRLFGIYVGVPGATEFFATDQ